MRHLRIFLLNAQYVFAHPSRSFVWFLVAFAASTSNLVFWLGALAANKNSGIEVPFIVSYYLLILLAGSALESHIEDEVANVHIYEGQLSQFLLKPYSYFWLNIIRELPYRILQGGYVILTIAFLFIFFGKFMKFTTDPILILAAICSAILAFILSYTFKMVLAFIAFWTIEIRDFLNMVEVLRIVMAGYIMPLMFFPNWLANIAYSLPFAYIVYFPVMAIQGKLTHLELIKVFAMQIFWITIFLIMYRILWNRGVKKFTGVGQ